MTPDVKIVVSCHKPGIHIPNNGLLVPVQVGAGLHGHIAEMLHDDDGENISVKNPSYCELTGQYWAWKHLDADYYGFLHYRRYFNFSDVKFPIHHEPFVFGDVVFDKNDDATLRRISFDEDVMRRVIGSHDFVAPEPIATPDGVNVYDQYRMSTGHHIEDLDTALMLIKSRYPDVWPSAERYLDQDKLYVCNMFVMRREIFRDYSSWLFDILQAHEDLVDTSHYSSVGRRVSGYLGERLCGIYLTYLYDSGLNGVDLQRVYFRHPEDDVEAAAPCPSKESLRFGTVTRGSGKIYSNLVIPSGCESQGMTIVSNTVDGDPIPAKLVDTAVGKTAVFPVLAVDQLVRVDAPDASGRVLAQGLQKFSPVASRLRSQKNTLLKNGIARTIRNCDQRAMPDDTRVSILHIIADVDGTDIVQGEVVLPLSDEEDKCAFVEVWAIGTDGKRISSGDWSCLSDSVELMDGRPGAYARRIRYSVRIPRVPSFVICAKFPDGERQDGFLSAEHFYTHDARREWNMLVLPACNDRGYEEWFLKTHRASQATLEIQRRLSFDAGPLFSIVVPLYRTPVEFFREMADSVLGQTYGGWELVLVNASPDDVVLAQEVESYCSRDERIKCVTLDQNRGITENTNEGIKVATGDFVSFLDHDDVLEPDCLFCYASAIDRCPNTDLLYCDEDKLENGRYSSPFFKPDWNPDLLLGMNYVCHFLTVRKSVVDALEPPGSEYDGSQDWHMTFRVGEKARAIRHVPRVLYHWRIHENSTAKRADQKDYALETSRHAVETHLERVGIRGSVIDSPLSPRRFVVRYDLGSHPLVSIVIPNKDSVKVLNRCLMSVLLHSTYDNYEIVVVENNSEEPRTFSYYDEISKVYPRVRIAVLEGMASFNFSRIVNFGASQARGEYLLFLNNDTEVISPGWIEELLGPCMRDDVGATGAKLLFRDGTVQHVGVTFGTDGPCHQNYLIPEKAGGNFESALLARDMSSVTGACLLTSAELFDAVGGMDEDLAVNYNDVDYCLKLLQRGRRIVFCPTAELYHHESVSRGSETSGAKALRFRVEKGLFMMRWPRFFEEGDPWGNPNFFPSNPYEKLGPLISKEVWE